MLTSHRLSDLARCERLPSGRRRGSAANALAAWCLSLLWLVLAPTALAQPVPDLPSRETSEEPAAELSSIDGRLWELRHEARRERWLAPMLLVVTGYGTALVGVTAAVVTFAFADDVRQRDVSDRFQDRLDVNNDGSIDRDDERSFRRMARSFAVVSGVGLAIGIVGSVLLARGLREPAAYAHEVRSLKRRRRELLRQLDYSGDVSTGRLLLSLRGRF